MHLFFPENMEITNLQEFNNNLKFKNFRIEPFSNKITNFFNGLSSFIFRNKKMAKIPEISAFAFWIRKANINNLLSNVVFSENQVPVPRGIVFHVAPSNVDFMFLYSWFLSVLAGNFNILRISSEYHKEVVELIDLIRNFAEQSNEEWFLKSNLVLTYQHNDEINEYFSSISDCRIFWGGDETIIRMRKFTAKPTVKDIYFSDKFSYAVINSVEYLKLNQIERKKIAEKFYNDSFLFNQKACSSPSIVFFSGEEGKNVNATKYFWDLLAEVSEKKQLEKSPSIKMQHFLNWSILATKWNVDDFSDNSEFFTVVHLNVEDIDADYRTCGGGFFIESYIGKLSDLIDFGGKSDQTLIYYGFEKEELKSYINNKGSRANLRIVKIGEALNFDVIWDGYNLLYELVKIINVV